jgi:hypothetical protein
MKQGAFASWAVFMDIPQIISAELVIESDRADGHKATIQSFLAPSIAKILDH